MAAAHDLSTLDLQSAATRLGLVALAKHSDPFVRRCAVDALGELGMASSDVGSALLAASYDSDTDVREHAAVALAKLPGAAVLVAEWRGACERSTSAESDNAELARRIAALAFALALTSESVDDSVARGLAAASAALSETAKLILQERGGRAVPAVLGILRGYADPRVRMRAIESLTSQDNRAVEGLLETLRDKRHAAVRTAAAKQLARIGLATSTVVEGLAQALLDEDASVRSAAAASLRGLVTRPIADAKGAVAPLITGLASADHDVRDASATVLGFLGADASAAVPKLLAAISVASVGPAAEPRASAASKECVLALGRLGRGNAEVVNVLSRALAATADPSQPWLHQAVAEALGALGDEAVPAVPFLAACLAEATRSSSEREAAAVALAQVGRAGVTVLLDRAADLNADTRIRVLCVAAAGRTLQTDRRTADRLTALLSDPIGEVKLQAAKQLALADLSTKQVLPILLDALEPTRSSQGTGSVLAPPFRILITLPFALAPATTGVPRCELAGLVARIDPDPQHAAAVLLRCLADSDSALRTCAASLLPGLALQDSTEAVCALVASASSEIMKLDEAARRAAAGATAPAALAAVFDALVAFGPRSAGSCLDITRFLNSGIPYVRKRAAQWAGSLDRVSASTRHALQARLLDSDPDVQAAAAEALLTLCKDQESPGAAVTAVAVDHYVRTSVRALLAALEESVPRRTICLTCLIAPPAGGAQPVAQVLPPFPWPPPQWASVLDLQTAPGEPAGNMLGTPETTLGEVCNRIREAAWGVDSGFETSLFGLPGGFAAYMRTERIHENGDPYSGSERWTSGKSPIKGLLDYFGRLFVEKPGHFRAIIFAVTTQWLGGSGTGELPAFESGAPNLPPDLASEPLDGRFCYVLIYTFEKCRGSGPSLFRGALNAMGHLGKSGLLTPLQGQT